MSDNHLNGQHSHEAKHESFHLDTIAVHLALLRTGKIIAFTGDDAPVKKLPKLLMLYHRVTSHK